MEEFLPNAEYPMGQRDGDQKQGEPLKSPELLTQLVGTGKIDGGKGSSEQATRCEVSHRLLLVKKPNLGNTDQEYKCIS